MFIFMQSSVNMWYGGQTIIIIICLFLFVLARDYLYYNNVERVA